MSQEGYVFFDATPELLAQMFGFAPGCVIDRIQYDIDKRYLQLRVKGPGLPPCPEGAVVVKACPTFRTVRVNAGEVALEDVTEAKLVSLGI